MHAKYMNPSPFQKKYMNPSYLFFSRQSHISKKMQLEYSLISFQETAILNNPKTP